METTILVGDCLKKLQELPDESVHCVVTSPPYWGLRSYQGDPGMIGLEPTFEEHLENLVAVLREVRRVLRKDGTLWLNYGDAYTSGNRATYRSGISDNKGHQVQDDMPRPTTPTGLKPKDLMMMPERVAMALQEDGWWLRQKIPWIKRNPMPESAEDRPGSSLEFVYLLAKSGDSLFWTHQEMRGVRTKPDPDHIYRNKETGIETDQAPDGWREDEDWKRINRWKSHDYFYDGVAIRIRSTSESWEKGKGKTPDGWDTGKGAHGSMHKKGREKGGARTDKQRGHTRAHAGFNERWDKMSKEEQQANGRSFRNTDLMFQSIREPWGLITDSDGNPLAIDVPAKGFKEAHFATFPPKLVEPCVLAGTSEKGCCAQCGAPWVREVDKEVVKNRPSAGKDPRARGEDKLNAESKHGHKGNNLQTKFTTTGWSPTCEHDSDPVPATVLDPFAGAGTVGLVAQRLGRSTVLIEISKEYALMAGERIAKDMPLFSQVKLVEGAGIEPATSCVQNRCSSN